MAERSGGERPELGGGERPEQFGPYLVYEQLGLGGMASVHRAEARGIAGFSRPVALKRMLPHVAANEDLVRSFVREARLASHLRHANVAQTLDLGKVGDTYFIAMELVPGKNLREVLSHCLRVCGPMPLPIAINIISQIADALDYAHNLCDETGTPLGIIHRDVSPSNVIVSEGGIAKLIDFGIAKASAASMQTMSRTIKGKFGYMAPEYIEGRLDARADLFALGVIAHELLANRPLFQGTDEMDTLYRVRTMTIEPPSQWRPQIPPELDSIVMTALARDPDVRWQGAHAMRTALTTEAQRLGLVAHGAQVDEWMTWAFQQKAGALRPDTPEISISSAATPTPVAVKPSAPHPRVVQRRSTPPQNRANEEPTRAVPEHELLAVQRARAAIDDEPTRAVPTGEFIDEQRTARRPSAQHPAVPPARATTVNDTPRSRRSSGDPPDTLKTPQIQLADDEEAPHRAPERPSAELPPFDDDVDTTNERPTASTWPAEEVVTQRPASAFAPPPVVAAQPPVVAVQAPRAKGRGWLLAILLLVAAAGAAAVVYFTLPYLT